MPTFLTTERLALRPFSEGDVGHLMDLHNDPDVMRFIQEGRPASAEAVRDQLLPRLQHSHPCTGSFGFWAAEEKETGRFVGWFKFRPLEDHSPEVFELGYRLCTFAWGSGYATEGSRALIREGFAELGVQRVTARTMTAHARSRRVMEKLGLTPVRTCGAAQGGDCSPGNEKVEYALTKAAWETRELLLSGPGRVEQAAIPVSP